MTVAVVGGAAIGVVGSVIAGKQAKSAAKESAQIASDADAARLAFEREQYDEWQATYGDVEDSLAKYYETLTPSFRITQGLEAHEKEMERARTNLRETLDQRGIGTSGIAAQLETEMAVSSAEERARIRAAAPLEVAKEKLGFLQVGLGQNPNAGMQDALSDAQVTAQGNARTTAENAGIAAGATIGAFTNLAQATWTGWMNRPPPVAPPKPGAP